MGEVTADDGAAITWTVHVANTKAAADRFFGKVENSGITQCFNVGIRHD